MNHPRFPEIGTVCRYKADSAIVLITALHRMGPAQIATVAPILDDDKLGEPFTLCVPASLEPLMGADAVESTINRQSIEPIIRSFKAYWRATGFTRPDPGAAP